MDFKKPPQSSQTLETKEGEIDLKEQSQFSKIDECISDVLVDFTSGSPVKNERDVEIVFNKYIDWAKKNNKSIFGHGNDWRFKNATIHGLYQNKKYWEVTASWFSKEDQKWRIKTVFDVSENGEVVRFLGCL